VSLDRSLKGANSLVRHRNVLTRPERLVKLAEDEKWDETKSVFGLPKVEHRKQEVSKGDAKDATAETAAGTPGAAPAGGAAPAAGGAKPGAPAAKGAAPAGKGAPAAAAPAKGAAPAAKKK
jgi:small basic protein (TIGR04137 family)